MPIARTIREAMNIITCVKKVRKRLILTGIISLKTTILTCPLWAAMIVVLSRQNHTSMILSSSSDQVRESLST